MDTRGDFAVFLQRENILQTRISFPSIHKFKLEYPPVIRKIRKVNISMSESFPSGVSIRNVMGSF